MKVYGGIYFNEDGIHNSIRGMHMQSEIMGTIGENINGFNKVGYQRSESVVSSFAEHIGVHGLSKVKATEVGRLSQTNNPLDFAMGKNGYFQVETVNGVKLTRDGRFKLDKDGSLLSLQGDKVLGSDGTPVKLSHMPEQLEDIKVGVDGKITVLDRTSKKMLLQGQISMVSADGDILEEPDVRQGFVENSNVAMHTEFFNMIPVKRNFEANRQMFLNQNDVLYKSIQQLGSAQ